MDTVKELLDRLSDAGRGAASPLNRAAGRFIRAMRAEGIGDDLIYLVLLREGELAAVDSEAGFVL